MGYKPSTKPLKVVPPTSWPLRNSGGLELSDGSCAPAVVFVLGFFFFIVVLFCFYVFLDCSKRLCSAYHMKYARFPDSLHLCELWFFPLAKMDSIFDSATISQTS